MLDTISIFLNLLILICDPRCDISWRFFHVHLRKMCILLFWDRMSWRYQNHVGGLMCHLRLQIHLVIFCCDGLSIGVSGVLNSPAILCYCCFPLLWLLALALCIEVLLCWLHIYNRYILGWSLDHYVVSFLISCNLLYFKVCFFWYEDCYSSLLLLPICTEYVFPSSHFQSLCVLRSDVCCL